MVRAVTPEVLTHHSAKYIELAGTVQGVGFRPFVYNLAVQHGLVGWVRNTSAGVEIQVEGLQHQLEAFVAELTSHTPPLAHIETITVSDIPPNGHGSFSILESLFQPDAYQLVSPDIAVCAECLQEMFDRRDRRAAYPFINCTNCGPRFTIIEDIPYDRPMTTMRAFHMCGACRAEYDDPSNRRFHAQPNACPLCGPHLWLTHTSRGKAQLRADQPANDSGILSEAGRLIEDGGILALKGLGGFHLACDATNKEAVMRLRERKHRPHKPFAVMMTSIAEVQCHCVVTSEEAALLCSPQSPIVLLSWHDESSVVRAVAPNDRYLGVMLPYTPLHHLLLREVGRPLVMTSGNLSEEPIAKDNDDAVQRLGPLADAFLLNNRDIYARYDDSVWAVPLPGRPQPLRRARGYAPSPIHCAFPVGRILACGAELKNTFCLTRDHYAFISQHIGDMENLETLNHFESSVALYEHLFRARPGVLACDMHPEYLATRYARMRAHKEGLPIVPVQHHHAHIASCLADNQWPEDAGPVIGVAFDGTGYGTDGTIWGGEFLVAGYGSFQRCGHLDLLPLPGGDAATHKPYRIALACLHRFLGEIPELPFMSSIPQEEITIVTQMVTRSVNTPLTSSCGRLFDAVSALLGVCLISSYEGHAAVELQMSAHDPGPSSGAMYQFSVDSSGGEYILRLDELFRAIVNDLRSDASAAQISSTFHRTLAQMIVHMCRLIRKGTGLSTVALSGGCFQNRLLLRCAVEGLDAQGFQVLMHRHVPCNDGGLSLGQAMVAHIVSENGKQTADFRPKDHGKGLSVIIR